MAGEEDSHLGRQSAVAEAHGLYRMLATGHTLEELRGYIGVPPKIERTLRFYAAVNPVEARWVEEVLMFRNALTGKSN